MQEEAQSGASTKSLSLANYNLFTDDLSRLCRGGAAIINTLNPHSFYIAESDSVFKKALQSSDVLLPDGVGVVWAARFLKHQSISRISGMDAFQYVLHAASKEPDPVRRRIFFLGAAQETLNRIKERMAREFPSLEVECYSPPFKDEFSADDNEKIITAIKKFNPHVIFVGMTAPKQEKWVFQNKVQLPPAIVCSIGAVFDFYAGTVKRPGSFWRGIGLEWLIRFLREPRRLWKRNLISGPYFIFRIFQLKFSS